MEQTYYLISTPFPRNAVQLIFGNMSPRLQSLLRCPVSGDELRLQVIHGRDGSGNGTVQEGILFSPCGMFYPVIKGIPRMNPDSFLLYAPMLSSHLPDYQQRAAELKTKYGGLLQDRTQKNRKTIKSFESEWQGFDPDRDRTWDEDREGMLGRFFRETNETALSLQQQLILDAGCGNGLLDLSLASMGMEVVAMDFTNSVERPAAMETADAVMFVQGDIALPPFAPASFDLVQCSGVLVHTAEPEKAFGSVAQLARPGGKLSVWVYHPQDNRIHRMMVASRKPMSLLPLAFQRFFIRAVLLPVSWVIKKIKGNRQTISEMETDLVDHYTPEFRWEFSHATIREWFRKNGFEKTEHTSIEQFGFNTTGSRQTIQHTNTTEVNGQAGNI